MTHDLRVVPFRGYHYEWLRNVRKSAEGGLVLTLTPAILAEMERANSWTGVLDGEPIVCAGTMEQWPGRHLAWAYVSRGTLPFLPWITENVKRKIENVRGRIEFTVRADFPAGQRWAKRLGFEVETPLLRAYGPEGEDHIGYVRFN